MFCHCNAGRVTVLHQLELRRHVDKKLFVRLILHGDNNFCLSGFSELFCCITLDVCVFLDLRLSIDSWYKIGYSYESVKIMHRLVCLLRFAVRDNLCSFKRSGTCVAKCA